MKEKFRQWVLVTDPLFVRIGKAAWKAFWDWVDLFAGAILGAVLWSMLIGDPMRPEMFTDSEWSGIMWAIVIFCGIYLILLNAALLVMELTIVGVQRLTGRREVDNRPAEGQTIDCVD